jgi:hypothetical protein
VHLQIISGVFAERQWRGLHTVGVHDSLNAINGIGHAGVMTDPGFHGQRWPRAASPSTGSPAKW